MKRLPRKRRHLQRKGAIHEKRFDDTQSAKHSRNGQQFVVAPLRPGDRDVQLFAVVNSSAEVWEGNRAHHQGIAAAANRAVRCDGTEKSMPYSCDVLIHLARDCSLIALALG